MVKSIILNDFLNDFLNEPQTTMEVFLLLHIAYGEMGQNWKIA